jgi:hypothetical protein
MGAGFSVKTVSFCSLSFPDCTILHSHEPPIDRKLTVNRYSQLRGLGTGSGAHSSCKDHRFRRQDARVPHRLHQGS